MTYINFSVTMMPRTNGDIIKTCVVLDWAGLAAFTIGAASLPSPPHDKWHWDTISQMVTRKQAVENGFAVFLTASTIVLGTIIASMLYRFEDAGLQGPYFSLKETPLYSALLLP